MTQNMELEKAVQLLKNQQYTCVLVKDDMVYTSKERGIKPLLHCYKEQKMKQGCSAADKVVGKAAAFFYVLLGAKELYAEVISKPALGVLEKAGIAVSYATLVDAIRNRTNTGFCPMETAVWEIDDPEDAMKAVEKTLETLKNK